MYAAFGFQEIDRKTTIPMLFDESLGSIFRKEMESESCDVTFKPHLLGLVVFLCKQTATISPTTRWTTRIQPNGLGNSWT